MLASRILLEHVSVGYENGGFADLRHHGIVSGKQAMQNSVERRPENVSRFTRHVRDRHGNAFAFVPVTHAGDYDPLVVADFAGIENPIPLTENQFSGSRIVNIGNPPTANRAAHRRDDFLARKTDDQVATNTFQKPGMRHHAAAPQFDRIERGFLRQRPIDGC